VRDGLRRTRGLRGQPTALLQALGSPRTAAATALIVQATARRTPVLLDGAGATAAALLARRSSRAANTWWQVAQRFDDPLHPRMLTSLDLDPLTDLGVRVEDGTAAVLGLAVLDVAASLLALDPEPGDGEPEDGRGRDDRAGAGDRDRP
jgi:nicotinate-nucleotide--dimethylbenzimidazole phosphoribosyltransferase